MLLALPHALSFECEAGGGETDLEARHGVIGTEGEPPGIPGNEGDGICLEFSGPAPLYDPGVGHVRRCIPRWQFAGLFGHGQ